MKTDWALWKENVIFALCVAVLSLAPSNAVAAEHWESRATGIPRRTGNSAVWTGQEMIVWGGGSQSVWLNDGGVYHFESNTWRATSQQGVPAPRWFHGAAWTGTEMLVFGGRASFYDVNVHNDGGRYNPVTDTWSPISSSNAPAPRSQFASVWTGTEFIVWGGFGGGNTVRGDGARYNPTTDTWTPMSNVNAPEGRGEPTAVWTGTEMIVFGGFAGSAGGEYSFNTGARYNPATDTWTPLPTTGAPRVTGHTAVWTGTDMIVWGGRHLPEHHFVNTGARYNPADNSWHPIAPATIEPRIYQAATWTGREMIIWGGTAWPPQVIFGNGARYHPASDSWVPMTSENAAHPRMMWRPDITIWTGFGMLLYGGSDYPYELNSTDLYVPDVVDGPPRILSQSSSQTVDLGETVTLKVTAVGTEPLAYQWQHNGTTLPDVTGATLTLEDVQLDDAGDYTVTVTNEIGSVTSSNIHLTVISNPPLIRITSFTPPSGPIGTTVTLIGSGFSSVASSNIVLLSGLRATVTAATESNLTFTVQAGATYGPITVAVNGSSAQSTLSFSVTPPLRTLDASAFDSAITFSPGDGPIATRIADLDGDGRPDLAVAHHYANTVAVYHNTGTGGVAGVFAPKVDYPAGQNIFDLHLEDLNGDGRPEMIVMNYGSDTVSVFRNVSTQGQIAFASRQDFPVNAHPHNGAVGDVDGDGRPDIVVAVYEQGKIAVLRNTSTSSGIDFAAPVHRASLPDAHDVGIQDLDGDGKADIVVARHSPGTPAVTVLRNTSEPGYIDEDTLEIAAELHANGNYVVFADIDGDGRQDIVTCSWYAHSVTLFQNLSTPGSLNGSSFGPPVTLPSAGSTKRIAVSDLDGDGRVDLAFPTELGDSLGIYRNVGGSNQIDASWFAPRIDLASGWNGDGISIGDIDLDGLPDIVFCSFYIDQVWIYRGVQPTAPEILSQPTNVTVALGANASLSVQATGGGLHYAWYRNGGLLPNATSATLPINNASSSHVGDYFVIVSNSIGAMTSSVVSVTVIVERTLALGAVADVDEGELISTPLTLVSSGEVSGIDFLIQFNLAYLGVPEIIWDESLLNALKEFSVSKRGELRGVIALPAASIPAGTQTLATVQFRARTLIESNVHVSLGLRVSDMSDMFGDPIVGGTEVFGTAFNIHDTGFLAGDNNANHQLDVGDAALLMRLLAQLDTVRYWDVSANDFNLNDHLDSGDVIKMLRAIAGLDGAPLANTSHAKSASSESASISPASLQGSAGQLVTFQVRLDRLNTSIAGASFTLDYPVEALRLRNAQGHRVGTAVPLGTPAVWNIAPAQTNYATQSGHITLALSGSNPWAASNTVLAEFTFEVQPGAASRYLWPIQINALEVTGNGFNNRTFGPLTAAFVGRSPISTINGMSVVRSGDVSFNFNGDVGASYRIDYSEDLVNWTLLREVLDYSETIQVIDPVAGSRPQRFYRFVPLP